MPAKQDKQPDQVRIVASLSAECNMPVGEMAALYEHERAALAQGAHITKFLHIFTTRKVLEIVRERALAKSLSKRPALIAA
jgi:hypothetical protein